MMARKETNSTAQTLVTKQKHKLKSVNYQKHAPLHNIGVNIQNTQLTRGKPKRISDTAALLTLALSTAVQKGSTYGRTGGRTHPWRQTSQHV